MSVPEDAARPDAMAASDAAIARCTPGSGITLTRQHIGDFVDPVLVTAPKGDDRLFVVERAGRILVVEDGTVLTEPFLDIRDQVLSHLTREQGLLGLAFHPDYTSNGRFFVYYSVNLGTDPPDGVPDYKSIVAEYHADPRADVADAQETRLMTIDEPAWNHNAGMLAFGPNDGYLYIALGDGGGGNDTYGNGQNTATLLGSILRVDVDTGSPYAVPADNPFVGTSNANEIWAYGLRNPWRFSFDSATGDLYIGDVGQDQSEEIDVLAAGDPGGANFGWPECEGDHDNSGGGCNQPGFTAPVVTKTHDENRCSIIGGYVYRGTCLPDLQGWYFFGDWCSGQVWRFQYSGGQATNEVDVTDQIGGGDVTSFGEDGQGELYIVHHTGPVYRIGLAP